MSRDVLTIKMIAATCVGFCLIVGIFLLAEAPVTLAAPVTCKPGATLEEGCLPVETGNEEDLKAVKTAAVVPSPFDDTVAETKTARSDKLSDSVVSLAPLPPAAILFGGALAGLLYLGRRRKIKAVQED